MLEEQIREAKDEPILEKRITGYQRPDSILEDTIEKKDIELAEMSQEDEVATMQNIVAEGGNLIQYQD